MVLLVITMVTVELKKKALAEETFTATIPAGDTTVTVTHSLGVVPIVLIEPNIAAGVEHFINGHTTSQFVINLTSIQPNNDVVFRGRAVEPSS